MQLIAHFVGEMLGRLTASAGGLSNERNARHLGLVLKLQLNFRNCLFTTSLYNSIFSCITFFFCSSFATCLHLVKKQKTITKQFVLTTQTAVCLTEPDLKDKTWTVKLSPSSSSSSRSSSMLPLHQTKQTLGAPLFHIWITLPENHTAD